MKKTKFLTRLGAVVFALAILFAMSVPAWADDISTGVKNDTYTGTQADGFGVTDNNKLPITKGIVIFNPDNATVREPDITFTYAATPVDAASSSGERLSYTVTDGSTPPKTVTVYNGVTNSISNATVTFAQAYTHAAAPTGTEVEHTGNLEVDTTRFNHAGVYRYVITETSNPGDITEKGLEAHESSYSNLRYLDLYIGNGTEPNTYVVNGAIIFKTNSNIDTTTEKTTGFEPSIDTSVTSPDYKNDKTVDRYFTYNLEVSKTITGGLADKTHEFPFEVAMSNAAANVTVDVTSTGTYTGSDTPTFASGVLTLNASLANGNTLTVTGIPKNTTVTVKETNDTTDEYTLTGSKAEGLVAADAGLITGINQKLAENGEFTSQSVVINGGQTISSGTIGGTYVKTEIGYTNTLSEISPTGLAFRVAPYVLMLAAGVSLIILFIKRKETEATDMI